MKALKILLKSKMKKFKYQIMIIIKIYIKNLMITKKMALKMK